MRLRRVWVDQSLKDGGGSLYLELKLSFDLVPNKVVQMSGPPHTPSKQDASSGHVPRLRVTLGIFKTFTSPT